MPFRMDIDTDTDKEEDGTDQVVPDTDIHPPEKRCIKQPGHPLCSLHLTKGASLDGQNLGLSERALKMLNITPPMTTRVFISNLAYGVNEAKLYEVFSMSGNIVELILHRYDHGESKGTATVQYAHPLGAVQTIRMFKKAKLFSRDLKVEQDKIGPTPTMSSKKLPDGLVDVEGGIAMGGSRLKVRYINGDMMIHHPECQGQGPHPTDGVNKDGIGGVIRIESILEAGKWPEPTPAQGFADSMYEKLQKLVEAGYSCVRDGVPQSPHIKELIKMAQAVQDEFDTRVMKRSSWKEHGGDILDTPNHLPELAAYLGTSYYIDLRKPKTGDEFETLMNQLEALGSQFDEVAHLLKRLRPRGWPHDHKESRNTTSMRRIWNIGQESVFEEIKDTIFGLIKGRHPWTRKSKISAFHPSVTEPPHHVDTHGIIIQATFGGSGGDHIMNLRGYTADHRFQEFALSQVKMTRGPLQSSKAVDQLEKEQKSFSQPHNTLARDEKKRADKIPQPFQPHQESGRRSPLSSRTLLRNVDWEVF